MHMHVPDTWKHPRIIPLHTTTLLISHNTTTFTLTLLPITFVCTISSPMLLLRYPSPLTLRDHSTAYFNNLFTDVAISFTLDPTETPRKFDLHYLTLLWPTASHTASTVFTTSPSTSYFCRIFYCWHIYNVTTMRTHPMRHAKLPITSYHYTALPSFRLRQWMRHTSTSLSPTLFLATYITKRI